MRRRVFSLFPDHLRRLNVALAHLERRHARLRAHGGYAVCACSLADKIRSLLRMLTMSAARKEVSDGE